MKTIAALLRTLTRQFSKWADQLDPQGGGGPGPRPEDPK